MSKTEHSKDELIIKFLNNTIDENELLLLEIWITSSENNKTLFENITNKKWVTSELTKVYSIDENAGWSSITKALQSESRTSFKNYLTGRWVAAAILIIGLGTGLWLFNFNPSELALNSTPINISNSDIKAPESVKAILTLADGRNINLEDASNGKLVSEQGVVVTKTKEGKIIYNVNKNPISKIAQENKLFVPKGSKPLRLVLSDGTEVWLNSGSTLIYPSRFVGTERKVKMSGEIFFDIAKNPKMPFKVNANGIETLALGTQFNINAYPDDYVSKITLIEGKIKVEKHNSNNKKDILFVKPGQQVVGANQLELINTINLNEVMAWKNGLFYFEGAPIRTIMNQISKHYNVTVEFKDEIKYSFVMKTSRNVPISELLKIMELTNLVHFKTEGNKIIVMSNKYD